MSVLSDLKPTKKLLVMNLLAEAGVDVSQWKHYNGSNPAANPKYCYNWSFEQSGELVVVCLWHDSLEEIGQDITFRRRYRAYSSARREPGASVRNIRDCAFGDAIETAYRQQLPIRVIVIDGKPHDADDAEAKPSRVTARMLDPVSWAATTIDGSPGDFLLIRGKSPEAPAIEPSDLELSGFEGKLKQAFIKHRRREAKMRRAKIDSAKALNGGKLVCEVPKCGFDFVARYGELGSDYAQVHHRLPLNKSPAKGREVKLSDLAIVCANCHAMIHRGGQCRPLASLIPQQRSTAQ